jgi:small subunit ribosomal protein S22
LLDRAEYEFILDRTCLQFEPDDLQYVTISHQVYDHLDEKRSFDKLKSTRHFGPLAFYLAWNRKVDNLILDGIQNDR